MPTLVMAPPPLNNDVVVESRKLSPPWERYLLLELLPRVQQAAPNLVDVQLTAQSASIGTTNLVPLATGLYRIGWYMRITTPASVSSSLTVSFSATQAVTTTQAGAALTGNTTATVQSGQFLMRCDPSTPLTYALSYTSVGTPAIFRLDIVVEGLL